MNERYFANQYYSNNKVFFTQFVLFPRMKGNFTKKGWTAYLRTHTNRFLNLKIRKHIDDDDELCADVKMNSDI